MPRRSQTHRTILEHTRAARRRYRAQHVFLDISLEEFDTPMEIAPAAAGNLPQEHQYPVQDMAIFEEFETEMEIPHAIPHFDVALLEEFENEMVFEPLQQQINNDMDLLEEFQTEMHITHEHAIPHIDNDLLVEFDNEMVFEPLPLPQQINNDIDLLQEFENEMDFPENHSPHRPIQPHHHIDNAILQEFDEDMQFPGHNVQIPQPANENGPHEVQIYMHDHNYVQIPLPANDNAPHEVQIDMHDHNYVQIPQPANDNVPHEVQIDMHEHNYFQPPPLPQEIEIAENLVPHVQPDHLDNAIPQEFVEDMPFAQENLQIPQPPPIVIYMLRKI